MSKFTAIILSLLTISVSANAQIYLRKDTQPTAPKQTAPQVMPKNNSPAPTDEIRKDVVPSRSALENAKIVANTCLGGKWETQPCLRAVSENNLTMASNYAADLSENGKEASAENIKQHCAASTAATRGEYPAAAMRSAYVECVNVIAEESGKAEIAPDQSQFQLLFSAVQCLDRAPSCAQIEQGLSAYK